MSEHHTTRLEKLTYKLHLKVRNVLFGVVNDILDDDLTESDPAFADLDKLRDVLTDIVTTAKDLIIGRSSTGNYTHYTPGSCDHINLLTDLATTRSCFNDCREPEANVMDLLPTEKEDRSVPTLFECLMTCLERRLVDRAGPAWKVSELSSILTSITQIDKAVKDRNRRGVITKGIVMGIARTMTQFIEAVVEEDLAESLSHLSLSATHSASEVLSDCASETGEAVPDDVQGRLAMLPDTGSWLEEREELAVLLQRLEQWRLPQ